MTLSELKLKLVSAHREENWELAKKLSQVKERLKKRVGRCEVCACRLRKPESRFCYMHFIQNRFYKKALPTLNNAIAPLVLLCAVISSAAAQPVPLKFVWNNPLVTDPGASNLQYKLYATTNLSLPTNQWSVTLLNNVFTNTPTTLCSTNSFVYGNWFFYMTWTNSMWKQESFFSNQAVPDRLPGNFLNFNLNLLPTP